MLVANYSVEWSLAEGERVSDQIQRLRCVRMSHLSNRHVVLYVAVVLRNDNSRG